ncbi:hypothetical protein RMATCC62417_11065 [Rhizopus microsporus]|nr:hypothetical protein RMATCC62417_11065 [Rhizopus microsporus]
MDEGSTPSSFDSSAMSTSSSLAPSDRILAAKSSVDGIGWNDLHRETLESFIERVHTTTMHAYSFSKFIFLRELSRARARLIIRYCELIDQCLDDYLTITNYQRPNFVFAQQPAIIEGTKIYTAYVNNVRLRFGQHLRRAVNSLLRIWQRIVDLRRDLSAQGMDDDEIKHRIRQDIFLPAQTFKQAISQQPIDMEQFTQELIYMEALEALQPVFDAYDRGYNFGPSINFLVSLNILVCPTSIVFLFGAHGLLVTSLSTARFSAKTSWEFDGLMLLINWTTDAELSTLIQKLSSRKKVDNLDSVALFKLMTLVSRFSRKEISGRCVAVDPERRDILYFVHENSTPEQPVKFRYTKQQQDKTWKTKKYRRLLQDFKAQGPDVIQTEQALSQQPSGTVFIEDFDRFLQARSEQSTVLSRFYRHTITNHDNGYLLFRKIRLSAYFNKQRAEQKLIQDLRAKFGEDAVFVLGNWSAPHARYHEPICGLGFRRLLRNMGSKSIL